MANLGTLTLDLIAKIGGFIGPLGQAERAATKSAKEIAKSQKELRAKMKEATEQAAAWGAAMASAAVAGAAAMTKAALDTADAIADASDAAGLSTDTLQEMRYAAKLSGMSVEELDANLKGFGVRIGQA
jgi:hypothetical protein